jgi:hypothetical protein
MVTWLPSIRTVVCRFVMATSRTWQRARFASTVRNWIGKVTAGGSALVPSFVPGVGAGAGEGVGFSPESLANRS